VLLIRIRIDFGRLDPDPHWQCKNGRKRPTKRRKMKKFYVFKLESSLHGDLGIAIVLQFLIKKI
jgi:hypothetical protein